MHVILSKNPPPKKKNGLRNTPRLKEVNLKGNHSDLKYILNYNIYIIQQHSSECWPINYTCISVLRIFHFKLINTVK